MGTTEFESVTSCMSSMRSNRLSYAPIFMLLQAPFYCIIQSKICQVLFEIKRPAFIKKQVVFCFIQARMLLYKADSMFPFLL